MKTQFLPYHFMKWGVVLVVLGVVFLVVNLLTDYRLESPILALYSGFLEQRFLVLSHSNITDELAMIFLLSGLMILVFCKQKIESERIRRIRYKAMLNSFLYNNLVLLFCVLFVFGSGFLVVLILNICSQMIIYLVCFQILKAKNHTS